MPSSWPQSWIASRPDDFDVRALGRPETRNPDRSAHAKPVHIRTDSVWAQSTRVGRPPRGSPPRDTSSLGNRFRLSTSMGNLKPAEVTICREARPIGCVEPLRGHDAGRLPILSTVRYRTRCKTSALLPPLVRGRSSRSEFEIGVSRGKTGVIPRSVRFRTFKSADPWPEPSRGRKRRGGDRASRRRRRRHRGRGDRSPIAPGASARSRRALARTRR